MIDEIYKFWNITPEYIFSDEFTGYEDLYPEFDKHTKETYERDLDGTINAVFDLYRTRGIVPIIYYTEAGLKTLYVNSVISHITMYRAIDWG